eukprot:1719690-Alexandrium_andersonii.AAC.1
MVLRGSPESQRHSAQGTPPKAFHPRHSAQGRCHGAGGCSLAHVSHGQYFQLAQACGCPLGRRTRAGQCRYRSGVVQETRVHNLQLPSVVARIRRTGWQLVAGCTPPCRTRRGRR